MKKLILVLLIFANSFLLADWIIAEYTVTEKQFNDLQKMIREADFDYGDKYKILSLMTIIRMENESEKKLTTDEKLVIINEKLPATPDLPIAEMLSTINEKLDMLEIKINRLEQKQGGGEK